jgi:hypothetical protein
MNFGIINSGVQGKNSAYHNVNKDQNSIKNTLILKAL